VFVHPEDLATWEAAANGKDVDWRTFLRGWGAAVDVPAALYHRQLAEAFPEARFVLTTRDPEAWYQSFHDTIHQMTTIFPFRVVGPWLPRANAPFRIASKPVFEQVFAGRFTDRAFAIQRFREWNDQVRATIPPERLLVFDVREGWEPLCRFLGVPVPEGPFPRVNDTAEFQARTRLLNAVSWGVLAIPPLALVIAVAAAVWAL
jgi:hypothetical protein